MAEIALSQRENRHQKSIAGAKKEGGLTLYESMTADDMAALVDAFTKKYDIKVKTRCGWCRIFEIN